jgi:hypothetical protein
VQSAPVASVILYCVGPCARLQNRGGNFAASRRRRFYFLAARCALCRRIRFAPLVLNRSVVLY